MSSVRKPVHTKTVKYPPVRIPVTDLPPAEPNTTRPTTGFLVTQKIEVTTYQTVDDYFTQNPVVKTMYTSYFVW